MTAISLRTFTYAPPRSLGYNPPGLPPKAPHAWRVYDISFAQLLAQLGQSRIAQAAVDVEAPLLLRGGSSSDTAVQVHLGGGLPGSPARNLCIALFFGDGSREDVVLAQPIQAASPDIPDSPVTLGTQPVTFEFQPLEVSQLQPLAGDALPGDRALALRGGVLGTVPAGLGGGLNSVAGIALIAAAPVSGHRAIMVTVAGLGAHADPFSAAYNFAGVSNGAAASGASISLTEAGGTITEPTWSWTPGAAVFVGPSGTLTQAAAVAGTLHQIGIALSATSLLVQPYPPITRN